MLYDVTNHPRLNSKSKALCLNEASVFEAQVLQAEALLGLSATVITAARPVAMLKVAVAMQVNWQITYDADPYVYQYETAKMTDEATGYKDSVPLVDPQAAAIVALVNGQLGLVDPAGQWPSALTSVRGPRG